MVACDVFSSITSINVPGTDQAFIKPKSNRNKKVSGSLPSCHPFLSNSRVDAEINEENSLDFEEKTLKNEEKTLQNEGKTLQNEEKTLENEDNFHCFEEKFKEKG